MTQPTLLAHRLLAKGLLWGLPLALVLFAGGSPHAAHAAAILVTTLADDTTADGACSLREAMANADANAGLHADCAAGAGSDTISFSVSGVIALTATLPEVTDPAGLAIDGTGHDVRVREPEGRPALRVRAPGRLELHQVLVFDGRAGEGLPGPGAAVRRANGAAGLPTGFQESVALSGLTYPMVAQFSPDGRVFVGEKSGVIKVFSGLGATTPTVFADLRLKVLDQSDRGLMGMALHPNFPAQPYVYVLYTHDAEIGGTAPKFGTSGGTFDPCDTPATGCVASARLSRLQAAGNVMTGTELVLVEDWCQQFGSHSVGTVLFGADGALYAGAGDAASFSSVDIGQFGAPLNPCGDPPTGVGGTQTFPTGEGGALRAQDLRTAGDPVGLDGTIIRVNPATGAAMPDNPLAAHSDPNARRIVAHGLRNPYRFTTRPGTNELWIGDAGWDFFEEINRVPSPTAAPVKNFGWPCYEAAAPHWAYDLVNLNVCENLYSEPGAHTPPYYTYERFVPLTPEESCDAGTQSISGMAFYSGGAYPSGYNGALFFGDFSRGCIWVMFKGGDGLPDPANVQRFLDPAAAPVQLLTGPGGDLFYVDIIDGELRRIQYFGGNQPPTAEILAAPTYGPTPLLVGFSAASSSDPDPGDTLTYAWDLDGDGEYDDSATELTARIYTAAAPVVVGLRVTDNHGSSDTAAITISPGNAPPTAVITTPVTGGWKAGDTVNFSGQATDPQQGTLPASALSWTLVLHHCPASCHEHLYQTFNGVADGSFVGPDHEYPSYLELRLTATDAGGLQHTVSKPLLPATVDLTFQSVPAGLDLVAGTGGQAAPFVVTVIQNSEITISAPTTQSKDGVTYALVGWSDGGLPSHSITANAPATYTAIYRAVQPGVGGRNMVIASNGPDLTWEGGTVQTAYLMTRLDTSNGGVSVSGLASTATSYDDTTAINGPVYCYVLTALGPGVTVLGLSDVLCSMKGLDGGATPPQSFVLTMNQTYHATMLWTAPAAGATSYLLQTIPLDGSPPMLTPYPATTTTATLPVGAAGTCFQLIAFRVSSYGTSNLLCGMPGISTLDAGEGAERSVREALADVAARLRGVRPGLRPHPAP